MVNPTRHRPALGALAAVLAAELVQWGVDTLRPSVPPRVADALLAFGVVGVIAAVGYVVQYVGKTAPWASDTHASAVYYASTVDPDHWREAIEARAQELGVNSVADAEYRLGLREEPE